MSEDVIAVRPDVITALGSEYLASGYKQDDVMLSQLRYNRALCESFFNVKNAYPPSDGKFHLSMTTATNCISQTCIIYAGLLNDFSRKVGEVYVIDFSIRFFRPVNETAFLIAARMTGSRKISRGIIYRMQGEVQNGAFRYDVKFLFPLEAAAL